MSGYIGNIPVPQATQTRQSFTATASQTTFNTAGYSVGYVDVFLNGVKLAPADYTATNGSDIVLATGAAASDILEIVAYEIFQVVDQDFTGDFSVDTDTLYVDSTNDRVGINTSSPSDDVEIRTSADAKGLTVKNTGNNRPYLNFDSNRSSAGNNLAQLNFKWDGTDVARIIAVTGSDTTNKDDGHITFSTSSTGSVDERMRIDSSGNVGIGTSSPDVLLELAKGSAQASLKFTRTNTAATGNDFGRILFENSAGTVLSSIRSRSDSNNTQSALVFSSGSSDTERMRIDSSGRVMIGNTAAGSMYSSFDNLVLGTGSGDNGMTIYGGNTSAGTIAFADGTSGTEQYRGWVQYLHNFDALHFATSGTERMRIDSSGNLLVGTTSSSTTTQGARLKSSGRGDFTANGGTCSIMNRLTSDGDILSLQKDGTTVGTIGSTAGTHLYVGSGDTGLLYQGTANAIEPWNPSTNSARNDAIDLGLTSNKFRKAYLGQNVFVRTTDLGGFVSSAAIQSNGGTGHGAAFQTDATSGFAAACFSRNSNNGAVQEFFYNVSSSAVGTITITNSATSYNTSSDYRLKENVETLSGAITRVKQLQPKRFSWIADDEDSATVDGFLAHEAQTVVPEAVTGTHNEVDDDGNAVMQGIDQSKLVPLLTAALQEAIAKIETLETKVAELEAN